MSPVRNFITWKIVVSAPFSWVWYLGSLVLWYVGINKRKLDEPLGKVTRVFIQPYRFIVGFLCDILYWTSIYSVKGKGISVKGVASVASFFVLWSRGLCIGFVLCLVWFAGSRAQRPVGFLGVISFSTVSRSATCKDYLSKRISSISVLCAVPIPILFIFLGQGLCAGLVFLCLVWIAGLRAQSADIQNEDVLEFR
jgi:hypothetical protein